MHRTVFAATTLLMMTCSAGAIAADAAGNGDYVPVIEVLGSQDKLPEVAVEFLTVKNTTAFDALRRVVEKSGVGIGITFRGEQLPASLLRPVASNNLKGTLPVLVDQLAKVTGFFYQYNARNRVLTVSGEQQFSASAPPSDAVAAMLKQQLTKLGGKDVLTDSTSSAITYRADLATAERISAYVDMAYAGRIAQSPTTQETLAGAGSKQTAATWEAKAGASLRETIAGWSATAGWTFVWSGPERTDYKLMASNTLRSDFKTAVRVFIDSLPESVHVQAELRPDNVPPMVYLSQKEDPR